MTSPSEERKRAGDVAQLLHKAIGTLPEDEQRAVLEYFVESGMGLAPTMQPALASHVMRDRLQAGQLDPSTIFTGRSVGPGHQLVPVRMSELQHQRLKGWCAEHGFHMSVVIRGLVERFLDDWDERSRRD